MAHPRFAAGVDLPAWKNGAATVCAFLIVIIFLVSGLWKTVDPYGAGARLAQAKVPGDFSIPGAVVLGTIEVWAAVLLIMPRFRRFGAEPAFTEGWGLYAASLGDALGEYTDESAKMDAASAQMRCAVALVVDTSLQAKGWTRAQAFDYLHAHLAIDDLDGQLLIDSYVARPGDALACMGETKIRALRSRAQQVLGGRFDLRDFHGEILKDGAMPLDILETKMKAWMDAAK